MAAAAAEVAAAAEAAQAAEPAAAASVVALALAAPLLRRWHARDAARHGAVAAGARPAHLTRHHAISLAGLAHDPANLLSRTPHSLRLPHWLADDERVCSNSYQDIRWCPAQKPGPQNVRRLPTIEHGGNRISVRPR